MSPSWAEEEEEEDCSWLDKEEEDSSADAANEDTFGETIPGGEDWAPHQDSQENVERERKLLQASFAEGLPAPDLLLRKSPSNPLESFSSRGSSFELHPFRLSSTSFDLSTAVTTHNPAVDTCFAQNSPLGDLDSFYAPKHQLQNVVSYAGEYFDARKRTEKNRTQTGCRWLQDREDPSHILKPYSDLPSHTIPTTNLTTDPRTHTTNAYYPNVMAGKPGHSSTISVVSPYDGSMTRRPPPGYAAQSIGHSPQPISGGQASRASTFQGDPIRGGRPSPATGNPAPNARNHPSSTSRGSSLMGANEDGTSYAPSTVGISPFQSVSPFIQQSSALPAIQASYLDPRFTRLAMATLPPGPPLRAGLSEPDLRSHPSASFLPEIHAEGVERPPDVYHTAPDYSPQVSPPGHSSTSNTPPKQGLPSSAPSVAYSSAEHRTAVAGLLADVNRCYPNGQRKVTYLPDGTIIIRGPNSRLDVDQYAKMSQSVSTTGRDEIVAPTSFVPPKDTTWPFPRRPSSLVVGQASERSYGEGGLPSGGPTIPPDPEPLKVRLELEKTFRESKVLSVTELECQFQAQPVFSSSTMEQNSDHHSLSPPPAPSKGIPLPAFPEHTMGCFPGVSSAESIDVTSDIQTAPGGFPERFSSSQAAGNPASGRLSESLPLEKDVAAYHPGPLSSVRGLMHPAASQKTGSPFPSSPPLGLSLSPPVGGGGTISSFVLPTPLVNPSKLFCLRFLGNSRLLLPYNLLVFPMTKQHKDLIIQFTKKVCEGQAKPVVLLPPWQCRAARPDEGHRNFMRTHELDQVLRVQLTQCSRNPALQRASGRWNYRELASDSVMNQMKQKNLKKKHRTIVDDKGDLTLNLPDIREEEDTDDEVDIRYINREEEEERCSVSSLQEIELNEEESVRLRYNDQNQPEEFAEVGQKLTRKKFGKMTYASVRQPRSLIWIKDLGISKLGESAFKMLRKNAPGFGPSGEHLLLLVIEDAFEMMLSLQELRIEIRAYPTGHNDSLGRLRKSCAVRRAKLYEYISLRDLRSETGVMPMLERELREDCPRPGLKVPRGGEDRERRGNDDEGLRRAASPGCYYPGKGTTLVWPTITENFPQLIHKDCSDDLVGLVADSYWLFHALAAIRKGRRLIAKATGVLPLRAAATIMELCLSDFKTLSTILDDVECSGLFEWDRDREPGWFAYCLDISIDRQGRLLYCRVADLLARLSRAAIENPGGARHSLLTAGLQLANQLSNAEIEAVLKRESGFELVLYLVRHLRAGASGGAPPEERVYLQYIYKVLTRVCYEDQGLLRNRLPVLLRVMEMTAGVAS